MHIFRFTGFICMVLAAQIHVAQSTYSFSSTDIIQRLKTDVHTLASEEMEGREAGTQGERKAADYISQQMEEAGVDPLFDGSWFQEFTFHGDWTYGEDNFFNIGEREFVFQEDFFVLPNAASSHVYAQGVYVGYGLKKEDYNDYADLEQLEDKVFFIEYYLPEEIDDSGENLPLEKLQQKTETAIEKGALAIVFVNTQGNRTDPPTHLQQDLGREEIPIFFARQELVEYFQQLQEDEYLFISADIYRKTYTAINVAGYWDNNADHTVVIGGHYDHLGMGGRTSRSPGVQQIHYGADDNASGVAGVLEAARFLPQAHFTSNNYLFIAFSAEEKGLLGSRHFTLSDAYDMGKVNYMFNLDMIGRMNDNQLTILGTGTSPLWDETIEKADTDINIRKVPAGVGGSDHTNFYHQQIPALFFFTGIHEDYHRPSDTPDKINYEGLAEVLSLAYNMIAVLDNKGKLEFTTAPATRRGSPRREGPTLGVMPDHGFSGNGMKIQAVIDDRPAQKAGIIDGDVIVRLGDVRVSDIRTYMEGLDKLSKNDTINILIIRGDEEIELEVEL